MPSKHDKIKDVFCIELLECLRASSFQFLIKRYSLNKKLRVSNLDWFLVSEAVVDRFQGLQVAALDMKLSDHCPILLHDLKVDYGPTSFKLFNSWLCMDVFDYLVCGCANEFFFKNKIRDWNFRAKEVREAKKMQLESQLADIDSSIDGGISSIDLVNERTSIIGELGSLQKVDVADLAQKAKVQWSVEGDGNSAFFHGLHVVMEDVIASGIFRGVRVGDTNLLLSHLFYADDALFMGDWDERNGMEEGYRRIHWVKWDVVLNSIDKGGLDIGALLGGSRPYGGGVWKKIMAFINQLHDRDVVDKNDMYIVIGDGSIARFWEDALGVVESCSNMSFTDCMPFLFSKMVKFVIFGILWVGVSAVVGLLEVGLNLHN
uniref:Reverse transcriptase domain-containing protein n=1 Tax=Lactuca sativa TaxID=4236 RepID=A0A9R1X5F6_LACSA|nr:hypothetical protein LSAT_V11C600333230 [Lactuca sativa]